MGPETEERQGESPDLTLQLTSEQFVSSPRGWGPGPGLQGGLKSPPSPSQLLVIGHEVLSVPLPVLGQELLESRAILCSSRVPQATHSSSFKCF